MIRRQVVMPVTPERLWAALTDPDEMVGWFGARVEWQLEPGSPARFHGDDGRDRAGRVEVVRPGRHLRFRWWPTDRRPESPDAQELAPGARRRDRGELRARAGAGRNPAHHPGTAGRPDRQAPPRPGPEARARDGPSGTDGWPRPGPAGHAGAPGCPAPDGRTTAWCLRPWGRRRRRRRRRLRGSGRPHPAAAPRPAVHRWPADGHRAGDQLSGVAPGRRQASVRPGRGRLARRRAARPGGSLRGGPRPARRSHPPGWPR